MDGASPGLINRKVKKKPYLQGFLASVACTPVTRKAEATRALRALIFWGIPGTKV